MEYAAYGVSEATRRNWAKLHTAPFGRLTTRANKRRSEKRVLPSEYFTNKDNAVFVQDILDYIDADGLTIMPVLLSLGIGLLKRAGIYGRNHVMAVLDAYDGLPVIEPLVTAPVPADEFDILGLLYQSYLHEGKKNIIGSYYTPQGTAEAMTRTFDLSKGALFLDPCCGSGSFLLSVAAADPHQIYGADNDKAAVLIAKINMLLKYRHIAFIPQIYCMDFLLSHDVVQEHPLLARKFDYIATNPPWGAMSVPLADIRAITSRESFSYFFVRAHARLKPAGTMRFLFPEAVLNVKVHRDIRKFILDTFDRIGITRYGGAFSGVVTRYVDMECSKGGERGIHLYTEQGQRQIDPEGIYGTENLIFNLLSDEDLSIVRAVRERGRFSLRSSIWGLGIVTGSNKEKLFPDCRAGMEKIYTGKEIHPYVLAPARHYLRYDRADLQQVAREEIYRAPEKLVYKFISNKLVFAYDDSASLFLNSANILIPAIPSMSMKAVMAFLNSSLFQFMYMKLFGEVKILKGNLMELPFPEITAAEDERLTALVDDVLHGDDTKCSLIEDSIFALYHLTDAQTAYIRRTVHGKTD